MSWWCGKGVGDHSPYADYPGGFDALWYVAISRCFHVCPCQCSVCAFLPPKVLDGTDAVLCDLPSAVSIQ
jgi:hypothetical protein